MERINTSMDNQGSNNNYNNGNSNGGNNGDGGKGNHNGQILMAFILISLIALFIMSLVTNQFRVWILIVYLLYYIENGI